MKPTTQHTFLTACAAATTLMLAASANANIIENGDFGTGDFTDWTQNGNTGATGVKDVSFDGISPLAGYTYYAYFGAVGSQGGILQTTMATIAGGSYVFSFWLTNPDGGMPSSDTISWDGNTVLAQTNPAAFGWTQYSYDVTATGTSSTIEFEFQQNPAYFGLTGVDVEAASSSVPEPSTYIAGALMLLPMGVSGMRMLHRSRKA